MRDRRIPWIHFNTTKVGNEKQAFQIIAYEVVYYFIRRFCIDIGRFDPVRRYIAGVLMKESLVLYPVWISFQRKWPVFQIGESIGCHRFIIVYQVPLSDSFVGPI